MRIISSQKFNIVRQSGLSDAGEGISLAISKFSKREARLLSAFYYLLF